MVKTLNKSPHIHRDTHTKHIKPLRYPIMMFEMEKTSNIILYDYMK